MLPAPANGEGFSAWRLDIPYAAIALQALQSLDSPFHGSHLNLRVADYFHIYLTFIFA